MTDIEIIKLWLSKMIGKIRIYIIIKKSDTFSIKTLGYEPF